MLFVLEEHERVALEVTSFDRRVAGHREPHHKWGRIGDRLPATKWVNREPYRAEEATLRAGLEKQGIAQIVAGEKFFQHNGVRTFDLTGNA